MQRRQGTLDRFMTGRAPPGAAVLHSDTGQVEWLPEASGGTIVCTRGLGDIRLVEVARGPDAPVPPDAPLLWKSAVPYLLSHVQKAVRRGLPRQAVEGAITLLYCDARSLWRRLPVIMVEDTQVSADIGFLVWCCLRDSAKPAWHASRAQIDRMLAVVHAMASARTAHPIEKTGRAPSVTEIADMPDCARRDAAWAVRCRGLWGGMGGDVAMLNGMQAQLLSGRARVAAPVPRALSPRRWPEFISRPDQMLPCAADFHCWRGIVTRLAGGGQLGSEEEVRAMIWDLSSGRNPRRPETLVGPEPPDALPRLQRDYVDRLVQHQDS